MSAFHLGRSWSGTRLEDECPCPKAACGLAIADTELAGDYGCDQHGFAAAKTIRQMHNAEMCPGG